MSKHSQNRYKGARDALLFRPPVWMGKLIREEADARGIGYGDVILEHLLPIYQERWMMQGDPIEKTQEFPMTG